MGTIAAQHETHNAARCVMQQNRQNATICRGNNSGLVTMWTPSMPEPVLKMLCHRGPVQSIAIDPTGYYIVTSGIDRQVKIWDMRTFKPLLQYTSNNPVTCT